MDAVAQHRNTTTHIVVAFLTLFADSTVAFAQAPAASHLAWTRAEYAATKFFVTVNVDVDLTVQPAAAAAAAMLPAPGHTALPVGAPPVVLSTIVNKVVGQHTTVKLWSRPDFQTLQRTALYTGRKYWYRLFRYTDDGVYSLKHRPADGEQERDVAQWSERNEDFYPHLAEWKGRVITEPEVLFHYLAVTPISTATPDFEFLTMDRGQALRVMLNVDGTRQVNHAYEIAGAQGGKRNDAAVDAVRLRLHVAPLSKDAQASDVKFLGLTGDVELLVDPQRRLVVELSGSADHIGEVKFILRRVVMAPAVASN